MRRQDIFSVTVLKVLVALALAGLIVMDVARSEMITLVSICIIMYVIKVIFQPANPYTRRRKMLERKSRALYS